METDTTLDVTELLRVYWNVAGRVLWNSVTDERSARLWCGVKNEEIDLNDYDPMDTARRRLRDYFTFMTERGFINRAITVRRQSRG